jgi:CubicO group peptidase (beta-lactamase class C family)
MFIVKSTVAVLCMAFTGVALAAGADTQRETFVRDLMAIDGIPGLQTVVVKDGRVVWTKNFGYAVPKHRVGRISEGARRRGAPRRIGDGLFQARAPGRG